MLLASSVNTTIRNSRFTSPDPVAGVNVDDGSDQITAAVSLLPQEIHRLPRFLLQTTICTVQEIRQQSVCHFWPNEPKSDGDGSNPTEKVASYWRLFSNSPPQELQRRLLQIIQTLRFHSCPAWADTDTFGICDAKEKCETSHLRCMVCISTMYCINLKWNVHWRSLTES